MRGTSCRSEYLHTYANIRGLHSYVYKVGSRQRRGGGLHAGHGPHHTNLSPVRSSTQQRHSSSPRGGGWPRQAKYSSVGSLAGTFPSTSSAHEAPQVRSAVGG